MSSWDDLRFFLEVARTGTLSAAGRTLAVNHTTVGRRLDAFERDLGVRLFRRSSSGFSLTEAGTALMADAEAAEAAVIAGRRRVVGTDDSLEGTLRIATTDVLARTFVLPVLEDLQRDHPRLDVDLSTSDTFVDLERGDADLAVRIAATEAPTLVSKRFGEITYGLYGGQRYLSQRGTPEDSLAGHTVLAYAGALGKSEQGAWLDARSNDARISLRSDSIGVLLDSATRDRGLTVLPDPMASIDDRLRRVAWPEAIPSRSAWFVYHPDQRSNARLRAAINAMEARAGTWVLT